MRVPHSCLLTVGCVLGLAAAQAGVQLVTGDANGNLHTQDSFILDVSADGDHVLFRSGLPNSGSTPGIPENGLYIRQLSTGSLRLAAGQPLTGPDTTALVQGTMSDDGRYVAWHTAKLNVYWRDTQTGEVRLVSPGAEGKCRTPILSGDGRRVAFVSTARNLVTDASTLPTDGRAAIHLYDADTQTTRIVSLAHNGAGLGGGIASAAPWNEFDFSADGRWVVFSSEAANVVPERAQLASQASPWVYRRNVDTGVVDIVCRNAAGQVPNGNFSSPRCDASANRIAFTGAFVGLGGGPTLISGFDAPFGTELYVKEMNGGQVWRLSQTLNGAPQEGAFAGGSIAISGDGSVAAFASSGTNFVPVVTDPPGSTDSNPFDVFRVQLLPGGLTETRLVTAPVIGNQNVGHFSGPFLPGSGQYVAFVTRNHEPLIGVGGVSSIWEHGYIVDGFNGPPMNPYLAWAAPLPEGSRGLLDTPLGDGIPNLRKYVFGLPANSSDRSRLPRIETLPGVEAGLPGDNREYLVLTMRVRSDLTPDFVVSVRWAGDLGQAGAGGEVLQPVGPPVTEGGLQVYRYRHPVPATTADSTGFLVVTVTGP